MAPRERAYSITRARSSSTAASSERPHPAGPSIKSLPHTVTGPIRLPFYPSPDRNGAFNFLGCKLPRPPSARMLPESLTGKPHRLSRLRSALRLLIIVLSGSVTALLVHTLEIYRGNMSLDLRKGELPMVWPARTNLAPTLILFTIASANFIASIAILAMSFKRSFRRPIRSRDVYRIVAGSFGVILWATALVVFDLLDKASKASLGHYSCMNKNVMSNGRFQYRAVCSEQGIAFYTAIGAACAEVLTLLTLGITALQAAKRPQSIIQLDEKASKIYRATGRDP